VEDVVRIFARVARRLPARLLLVGDGPDRSRVQQVAEEEQVIDRVLFLGKQISVAELLTCSDLFLLPSEQESFGLVALEAAACGTPVVAAAVGGLRTLVEHEHTGFLVEGRDPADFAAYAREILAMPAMAAELSSHAAHRARDYTWSTAAGRLRRLYADLTTRALVDCS
jgi:glycosyltransferase involved in cell wall biosynthesis